MWRKSWKRSSDRLKERSGAAMSFFQQLRTNTKERSMPTAEQLIAHLGLQPHPKEGGFFRETYRAAEMASAANLPERYGGARSHGTAIYYLLTPQTYSALHR